MTKTAMLFIALPFIAGLILLSAGTLVRFKASLSPAEEKLLTFTHESLEVIERHPVFVTNSIKSPIEIPVALPVDRVPEQKPPIPPETVSQEKKVSLILIKDSKKMTIINGIVLKEGDTFGDSEVLTIEKNRVLIRERERGRRWLELD